MSEAAAPALQRFEINRIGMVTTPARYKAAHAFAGRLVANGFEVLPIAVTEDGSQKHMKELIGGSFDPSKGKGVDVLAVAAGDGTLSKATRSGSSKTLSACTSVR